MAVFLYDGNPIETVDLAALFSYRALYWVIFSRCWSFPRSTTPPSSSSSPRSTLKMGDDKIMNQLVKLVKKWPSESTKLMDGERSISKYDL